MLNETEEQASLTNWQKEQLQGLPNEGVECLLKTWTDFAENHDKNRKYAFTLYLCMAYSFKLVPLNSILIRLLLLSFPKHKNKHLCAFLKIKVVILLELR